MRKGAGMSKDKKFWEFCPACYRGIRDEAEWSRKDGVCRSCAMIPKECTICGRGPTMGRSGLCSGCYGHGLNTLKQMGLL